MPLDTLPRAIIPHLCAIPAEELELLAHQIRVELARRRAIDPPPPPVPAAPPPAAPEDDSPGREQLELWKSGAPSALLPPPL